MTTLEIVEKMLMMGIHPDWINAVYNKGKDDAKNG